MDAAEKAARKAHQDELKQAAAEKALDWLTPGKVVGVGSGSTVAFFIEALGRRRKDFPQAVSSSLRSTELLREAGIEVLDLNQVDEIDCYVDGADEVDPGFALIKGGGGALTREKIVAQASRHFVCIEKLGGTVRERAGYITDNGNPILDVSGLQISDPVALEETINQWPGVVTNGIFARRRPETVLIAGMHGVQVLGKDKA